MTKILFKLQKGNMVWYTLSGLNIKSRQRIIRPYYLSGAEIIYNIYLDDFEEFVESVHFLR